MVLIETPPLPYRANRLLAQRPRNFIPPEAAAQAKALVAALPRDAYDEAKFMAIIQWVREKIKPGADSRTLDDVWFGLAGNAPQRTLLAREMAYSAGLNANLACVNEYYEPGKVWHSKNAPRQWEPGQLADFSAFGQQMLVLQQHNAPDRWVQFMGRLPEYYSPSDVQPNQPGSLALIYTDDGPRLKRVNGEALGVTAFVQRLEIALEAEGAAKIKGVIEVFGKMAGDYREGLADPRQRLRFKEMIARSSWPKMQTPTVEIRGDEHAGAPVNISYSGSVAPLADCVEGAYFLAPFPHPPQLLGLRGEPERQHDLLLRNEFAELDHTLTYTCPAGCAWVEAPESLFMATEFGFFLADYRVRGRTLACTRSFLLPAQRITPEKYVSFQNFLKKVAENQQQRVAYAPLKREGFGPYLQEILFAGYAGCGEEKPLRIGD